MKEMETVEHDEMDSDDLCEQVSQLSVASTGPGNTKCWTRCRQVKKKGSKYIITCPGKETGNFTLQCPKCGKQYKRQNYFETHLKKCCKATNHEGPYSTKCRTAFRQAILAPDMKSRGGVKGKVKKKMKPTRSTPMSSSKSNMLFTGSKNLIKQEVKQSGKRTGNASRPCPICRKRYKTRKPYENHLIKCARASNQESKTNKSPGSEKQGGRQKSLTSVETAALPEPNSHKHEENCRKPSCTQDDDALREFTSLSQEKMDEILLEAWTDLMLNLDANNLFLRKLQQVGILDWSTANTVQSLTTTQDQVDKILVMVKNNINNRLPAFIKILNETGHKDLAKKWFLSKASSTSLL